MANKIRNILNECRPKNQFALRRVSPNCRKNSNVINEKQPERLMLLSKGPKLENKPEKKIRKFEVNFCSRVNTHHLE